MISTNINIKLKMLKAAQRLKLSQQQSKLTASIPVRSITTRYPWDQGSIPDEKTRDFNDFNLDRLGHLGILKMNREHRYNTLTPHYVQELKRAIDTMNIDDDIKIIFMVPEKGEHFCNGTDFRTLLHYKSQGDHASISTYINNLYDLHTKVAKLNKPLMAAGPGHAFNSGAALLATTSFPVTTLDAKVSFNDTSFGFVPHGGSTYILSRLPGELGTFLALTGFSMIGKEAEDLGIVDDLIYKTEHYEEQLADIVDAISFPIPNYHLLSDKGRKDPWQHHLEQKFHFEEERMIGDIYERTKKKHDNLTGEVFYEPKDKMPAAIAKSEQQYRDMMRNYNNSNGPDNEVGYLENGQGVYQNYFAYIMNHTRNLAGQEFKRLPTSVKRHEVLINRCFYPNTVEEIIENLKAETDPFAKVILEKMQRNSLLSMKIALKMLRLAKNQDFKGILETEMNVALNKIQDSEFELGIKKVLMTPSKGDSPNPGFSTNVSDDQVQSYFQDNKYKDQIKVDCESNALLPTRFYYDKYADAVRLWINNESTTQSHVRETFDEEVKQGLKELGMDVRDRALTQETARNVLYDQERLERRKEEWKSRMNALLDDPKLKEKYQNNIMAALEELGSDTDNFYRLVNEKIQGIFEDAYIDRLSTMYEKSKEVQGLEKRRMFLRLKKFLFQSRVLVYTEEELNRTMQQAMAMPFKEIHLTEKWDETYRNMEHPDIQKSFLWHISKAIGKVNITPPELTKAYLTNPQARQQMDLFTFDKAELEKLQKDVLANPTKYEDMLTEKKMTFETEQFDKFNRYDDKRRRREEYVYWYRVLNQGKLPFDSLPYQQDVLYYQDWVDTVEEKALNTLKFTIGKLLLDFESSSANEIREYEQGDKSKSDAYKRLLKLVHDKDNQIKVEPKKTATDSKTELVSKSRSNDDIRRVVNNLILEDKDLKGVFGTQEQARENPLIKQFREEQLKYLIQLLEIALLKNSPKAQIDTQVLQERYAKLVNPKTKDEKIAGYANLSIIDAYLSDVNSETLIKQAIQIVKPYFFHTLSATLVEETDKITDAFEANATFEEVFFYYMFHLQNPGFRTNKLIQKFLDFNADREREKVLALAYPELDIKTLKRQSISFMGQNLDKATTPEEIQRQVKTELNHVQQFDQTMADRERQYKEATEIRKESYITKPHLWDRHAMPEDEAAHRFNPYEINELQEWSRKFSYLEEQLLVWREQVQELTNPREVLHMYSSLITHYGMDYQEILNECIENRKFMSTNYLGNMRKKFGGSPHLQWKDLGEYAGFIEGFWRGGGIAFHEEKTRFRDVEKSQALMISEMKSQPGSAEQHARQQSVFEMMMNENYNLGNITSREEGLRQELKDLSELRNRKEKIAQDKLAISQMMNKVPDNLKERVKSILDTNSKYVDLRKLRQCIQENRFDRIRADFILNTQLLLRDVASGKAHQDFMNNYQDTKCDVVSLAEARTIADATHKQDDKHHILTVIDNIEQGLRYVPNDRRKEITLGDYLRRHHHLNVSSLTEFSNDVLKNVLERHIGKRTDLNKVDNIEWQYGNYLTNPLTHEVENQRIQDLAENGLVPDSQLSITANVIEKAWQDPDDRSKKSAYLANEPNASRLSEKEMFAEATLLCKIRSDFIPVRDFFENFILRIYTDSEFDHGQLEQCIQQYTDMRVNEALLQPGFKQKLQSDNGHIYMKVLKEHILDELKLTDKPKLQEFRFQNKIDHIFPEAIAVEGKYNLHDLNNTEAIGYNKLAERAANPEQNRDIAHDNVFDKLLAEYFLTKRSQHKKANELYTDLSKTLVDEGLPEDHPGKTANAQEYDANYFSHIYKKVGISFQLLKQDLYKPNWRELSPQNFNAMMELDVATQMALQNGRNGLGGIARTKIDEDYLTIPEYYDLYDIRKPAKEVVEDQLEMLLNHVFDVRKKVEKTLNRAELVAYDTMLQQFLQKDQLMARLRSDVKSDFAMLDQAANLRDAEIHGLESEYKQVIKTPNTQKDFNKEIKDEDSLYKFLAYTGMLEKTRRADLKTLRKDDIVPYGVHEFTEFYKDELLTQAKREPRKINPEDYRPKDPQRDEPVFLTRDERQVQYFKDFELYKENKKEQHDRNRLFFVLEQFFAKAREERKPMDKAQEAIEEYFADSENTYFYDKNKIQ